MILVLNFGAQYVHLIARRIRDMGVYSEILPCDVSLKEIGKLKPDGIILSGGPASVYEHNAPLMDRKILGLGIPILGICYGLQLIGKFVNGEVLAGKLKEFGKKELHVKKKREIAERIVKKRAGLDEPW